MSASQALAKLAGDTGGQKRRSMPAQHEDGKPVYSQKGREALATTPCHPDNHVRSQMLLHQPGHLQAAILARKLGRTRVTIAEFWHILQ